MNAKLNIQSKHKENRLFRTRFIRFLIALAAMTVSTTSAWGETKSIKYLTYSGGAITEAAYPVDAEAITSGSNNLSGWYYVEGNVTISSTVTLSGDTHLILCDGATLTINVTGSDYGINLGDDLTIYAQSSGSHAGKLIINGVNNGIFGNSGNITINGGIISVTSTSERGVCCANFIVNGGNVNIDASANERTGIAASGNITVNGGNLSATGGVYAIWTFGVHNVTINGGQVYAKGGTNGVWSRGTVNLGWTNVEDYIRSSGYDGTGGSINTLKDFYIDGSTTLATANNISSSIINGKKLTPNPTTASYTISLGEGITGGTVEVDRTKAFAGERVAITVTPPTGKILASLTYNDGTNTYTIGTYSPYITRQANDYVITMPAANVTVNATFATPVASITSVSTTTYYLTLSDAFDDIISNGNTSDTYTVKMLRDVSESSNSKSFVGSPTGRNIVIDVNGNDVSYGSITNKYQKLTITDTSTNHDGTMTFGSVSNQGAVAIENVTAYFGSLNNPNSGINDLLSLEKGAATFGTSSSTERTLEWDATRISLDNNSHLIIYSDFYFNQNSNDVTFSIFDTASTVELRECSVGGMKPDKVYNALIDYVQAGKTLVVDGSTKNNLTMRLWDLALDGTNIGNAVVKFFDFGTTEPSASNFNPSLYTADLEIDDINNSDGQDRYILVRLDLAPGCITDKSLLTAYETPIGSTIDNHELNLLLTDNYNAGTVETVIESTRLWYYYKLPGEHHAPDFTKSVVEGDVVPQFNFSTGITQVNDDTNNIHTVTVSRTTDTWTATLTYNKFVWKFDGSVDNEVLPQVQSISICKGGLEKFRLTTRAEIDAQVQHNYGSGIVGISTMKLKPQGVNGGWFISTDEDVSEFTILVPFDGDGSTGNPWQIKTAADLSLLAKCVNVGRCTFEGQDLKLTGTTYDMSGSGFEPIGIDPYQPFMGKLICNGTTIRNITYTYDTPEGLAVTDETPIPTIGLVGNLEGSVENARLESCSFSSESDSENCYVGSIAGFAKSGSVKDCHVIGGNVSAAKTGSYTGAIVGKLGGASLSNNYYDYTTIATLGSSTASGYTKRGICTETISVEPGSPSTYDWKDFPTSEGAVLWVKKATINETKPTGSTSSVAFSQKTPGDNCYALDGNDVLYAVGQPITLTVTEGQSKADGLRTFYDGLSGLTVNGSSDGVDLANRKFSMPEAGATATIAATFTPSDWFTIPSNGKKWMSFYHVWTDANKAPENYTVSDYNTAGAATPKTIEVKTITAADSKTGEVTFGSLEGVSYSGMPTLFHCETVLPDVLKFTPNTTATTTVTPATQFIGVDTATPATQLGDGIYVMNGDGDFIWASDTSEKLGAHKCYVDLGKAAGRRLTVISDDNATGIHSIDNGPSTMDDADGAWYSIDGRKLQGKPTKKGLYIYKGKKTVIK